jgi:hypothetical protein
MSITIADRYTLDIKLGGDRLPLTPNIISYLTIIQDINTLVPYFTLRLSDAAGYLSHERIFDSRSYKVDIDLSRKFDTGGVSNNFSFKAYRSFPEGESATDKFYEISGLLDVSNLFAPSFNRGWTGKILDTLNFIATDLGISTRRISAMLAYEKRLLQTDLTNAKYLKYLTKYLLGSDGTAVHKAFITNYLGTRIFNFDSMTNMATKPIRFIFAYNFAATGYDSNSGIKVYPMYHYRVINNYRVNGLVAGKTRSYSYFNYDTGEYVTAVEDLTAFTGLSKYTMISNDDIDQNNRPLLGRKNDFAEAFLGFTRSDFYDKIYSLIKMWITVEGNMDILPGDKCQVIFPDAITSGQPLSYQYAGNWIIERVVHTVTDNFATRLLLTREGIDTAVDAGLVKN